MAIQENSLVCGRNGYRYRLEKEIGAGGEGRVYRVAGENLVAKIYKKVEPEVEQKIRFLVSNPIADLYAGGKRILALAWPKDILCDNQGSFIGYTMPFIQNGVEICTVARGCDMPKAKVMFPDYDWLFGLQVAINLSKAVEYLHAHACIIGDLNCKNIMVSPDGCITLLDNDSFDMRDPATGAHYRCCAGTQDYLAPELQGRNLRSPNASFTPQSDDFALAIHIFQLLMNNYHPFTGKNLVVIQNSTSVNQRLDHLVNGKCPFLHTYSDLTVPVGAPYLPEVVSEQLRMDFYRTFDYNAANISQRVYQRTTAAQWAADLQQFWNRFYTPGQAYQCSKDRTHFYLAEHGRCGLCAAQERLTSFRNSQAPKNATKPTPPPAKTVPTPPAPSSPAVSAPQTGKKNTGSDENHSVLGCLVFAVIAAVLVLLLSQCDGSGSSSSSNRHNAATVPPGTIHTHVWSPATYDRPEYCLGCGAEQGEPLGYLGTIYGEYGDATVEGQDCGMITLDTPINGMRSMTVNLTIEIISGTMPKYCGCYFWDGGKWSYLGSFGLFSLIEGSDTAICTFTGDGTQYIDRLAFLPVFEDTCSYMWGVYLSDVRQTQ